MMEELSVSGIDSTSRSAYVEFEDYIPLKFRSYLPPLGGVKDVRLGNRSTAFLELTLSLETTTLRGFTLLCFDAVHSPAIRSPVTEVTGLPILDIDHELFKGHYATQWLNLSVPFSVGLGADFIEIDFGALRTADIAVVCGSVKFLLKSNTLVGIEVRGISESDLACAKSMADSVQFGRGG